MRLETWPTELNQPNTYRKWTNQPNRKKQHGWWLTEPTHLKKICLSKMGFIFPKVWNENKKCLSWHQLELRCSEGQAKTRGFAKAFNFVVLSLKRATRFSNNVSNLLAAKCSKLDATDFPPLICCEIDSLKKFAKQNKWWFSSDWS